MKKFFVSVLILTAMMVTTSCNKKEDPTILTVSSSAFANITSEVMDFGNYLSTVRRVQAREIDDALQTFGTVDFARKTTATLALSDDVNAASLRNLADFLDDLRFSGTISDESVKAAQVDIVGLSSTSGSSGHVGYFLYAKVQEGLGPTGSSSFVRQQSRAQFWYASAEVTFDGLYTEIVDDDYRDIEIENVFENVELNAGWNIVYEVYEEVWSISETDGILVSRTRTLRNTVISGLHWWYSPISE
ncbi:MAG: hypothetical protein FWG79_01315 [Bacteroidales bacterium]|nr:hypothetical protein [Bacteroidales bacterium]